MTHQKVKRVSITIDETLLKNLDRYVELQKTINDEASRSGEICKLVEKYIPVESPCFSFFGKVYITIHYKHIQ